MADETPEAICTEPIDIHTGIKDEQAHKVAAFMGFEGEQLTQVWRITGKYLILLGHKLPLYL